MHYNSINETEELEETIKTEKVEGLIYNIQRYSLHDGPGIRTIVFLKGCPLRCPWCANPESQHSVIEHMGAEVVGKLVTVNEVIDVVKRDSAFYKRSGGGMTLSGGEPLMQPCFSSKLVDEAKNLGINVTIETSGYQRWDLLWKVIEKIDVVLLDIKTMDSNLHKKLMGADNELILQNAKKMSILNKHVIVRIPVIPGYNDSVLNLSETAQFCNDSGIKELHFLPYHQLGVHKYEKLNREYLLKNTKPINKEKLLIDASSMQDKYGITVKVY